MRRTIGTLTALLALAAALWTGARGAGPVPPLGPLLDPVHGAWAAARHVELPARASARIPGLSAPVDVRYDRRGVPHIFAASEDDAIRALGFVVARDRLFQLDVQTRAAAGRLTEWVGPIALDLDREMRELGLPHAAERVFASLSAPSRERRTLEAFADGVNAWIDGLDRSAWPIEYRLLGTRPERWQPVNAIHLFTRMGWTLAYLAGERERLAAAAVVGTTAAEALFPLDALIQEPIEPNGDHEPRIAFTRLPPPGPPDSAALRLSAAPTAPALLASAEDGDAGDCESPLLCRMAGVTFASNNWAVAPRRTAGGHALLAGDPHLELTLPSIWYESHLVVPGDLDVYGVTIPGAPGILIGFTRDLAWSLTNTGADVLDYFRETVDDAANPTRHLVDGAWRELSTAVEVYRGRRGEVLRTDTLRYTHRGPLVRVGAEWLSMRWTILDPLFNPRVFLEAARATGARAFLDVMARGFGAPAQNMIVADRTGSIGIRSTGNYPLRAGRGDGLSIRDGSRSANDWTGFWPVEQYPQAFDPLQGYLASANQQPVDPRHAYAYLGYEAAFDPWRALQLNRLLRADSMVTPDAMRRYQTDPGSVRAELFAPFFERAAVTMVRRGAGSARLDSARAMLAAWDRRYTPDSEGAVLFEASMRRLAARAWDELAPDGGRRVATPSGSTLLRLVHDPSSVWWDERHTNERVEDRDVVMAASLEAAWDSLQARFGPPGNGAWRVGRALPSRVTHLLGLPGFSVTDLAVQGGPGTMSPTGRFGPSWRMVVELGPEVRAWGAYPGGQSGNPVSAGYVDRLDAWRTGQLDTLRAPADTAGLPSSEIRARLTLLPPGGRR
jgi:penicillin amidase